MFKDGEKVYCKKNLEMNNSSSVIRTAFMKGKWYTVEFDDDYSHIVHIELTMFNYGKRRNIGQNFGDYFYTQSEVRKMKLDKLNRNNNIFKRIFGKFLN